MGVEYDAQQSLHYRRMLGNQRAVPLIRSARMLGIQCLYNRTGESRK